MRFRIREEEEDWPFIQFLDRFISARARVDSEEHRQQRVFVAAHLSSLVIGTIFAIYCAVIASAMSVALVFLVGQLLHAISLAALAFTGARVPLALFSGAVYLGQLVALVVLLGGVQASPTFVWWASLPVMALFMIRGLAVWAMTSFLFLITLVLSWMEMLGHSLPLHFPAERMGEFTLLSTVMCLAHVTFLLLIVQRIQKSIETTLRRDASTDSLTGALNHGAFLRFAKVVVRSCQRMKHPCVIAVIDMDLFKNINDRFGHPAGDATLKALVAACRKHMRDSDPIGRLGGDEFAAALPNANADDAVIIMKRMQEGLRQMMSDSPSIPPEMQVSTSIGLAVWIPSAPEYSATELLDFADQQLYDVKRTGRGGIGVRNAERPR